MCVYFLVGVFRRKNYSNEILPKRKIHSKHLLKQKIYSTPITLKANYPRNIFCFAFENCFKRLFFSILLCIHSRLWAVVFATIIFVAIVFTIVVVNYHFYHFMICLRYWPKRTLILYHILLIYLVKILTFQWIS